MSELLKIAKLAKKYEVPYFGILTSSGANSKSSIFYLKNKGDVEEAIAALGLKSIHVYQPGLITNREDNGFRLGEWVGKFVPFIPKISGDKLGKYILNHSINNAKKENSALSKYSNKQLGLAEI